MLSVNEQLVIEKPLTLESRVCCRLPQRSCSGCIPSDQTCYASPTTSRHSRCNVYTSNRKKPRLIKHCSLHCV